MGQHPDWGCSPRFFRPFRLLIRSLGELNHFFKTMNQEKCIKICEQLLEGERSAVKTYDKAISKVGVNTAGEMLSHIREDHQSAAQALKDHLHSMDHQPSTGTGAWGSFSETVQSTANLFGDQTAIESLKTGEQAGKRAYEKALENEDVADDCKTLIRTRLLPQTDKHIEALKIAQEAA